MAANQRDMAATLAEHGVRLHDTNTRVRSLQETTGEIKELLIRWLDR